MKIYLDRTGSIKELDEILNQYNDSSEIKGVLILSCDENNFDKPDVDSILKNMGKPIFGGIFPQIIFKKENLTKGTIIVGLIDKPDVQIIHELSNEDIDYEDQIDKKFPDVSKTETMFVFVDGFSKRISSLIESMFNVLGLDFNYIGGGTGSLSFQQKPCLFTNEGLIEDSAILISYERKSGVGVEHGWSKISKPFKVTESDRNVIKTLDWQPAFEVYKKVVESHSGMKFGKDNFFDISKSYPFGISKHEAESIVRDPFQVGDNNSLICVGEVPTESYVNILNGNIDSLVNAAKEAQIIAKQPFDNNIEGKTMFFIDCISRVLFLEKDFKRELEAVYDEKIPLIGALSIGEIANSKKDYLEFYNKTAVVGILE